MLNGSKEFCQEFLTDVRVPDADRIGDVDDGWTVSTRWMFHERMLYNSPYVTWPAGTGHGGGDQSRLFEVARQAGRLDDTAGRELGGEGRTLELVGEELQKRLSKGIATGAMSDQSAAVGKIFHGLVATRRVSIAFELAGPAGAAWDDDDGGLAEIGNEYLMRQTGCIGGGTTEMA